MQEREWLSCTNPMTMLAALAGSPEAPPWPRAAVLRAAECSDQGVWVSARKLRLLACAAVRLSWDVLTPPQRQAVEAAEAYADRPAAAGLASVSRRLALGPPSDAASQRLHHACRWLVADPDTFHEHAVACNALSVLRGFRERLQEPAVAAQVRDLVGPPLWRGAGRGDVARWLSWQGGTVAGLARAAYDGHAWDRMPVLADALEEAGCEDEHVLHHCRGGGPLRRLPGHGPRPARRRPRARPPAQAVAVQGLPRPGLGPGRRRARPRLLGHRPSAGKGVDMDDELRAAGGPVLDVPPGVS